jgi:hypothetical protein
VGLFVPYLGYSWDEGHQDLGQVAAVVSLRLGEEQVGQVLDGAGSDPYLTQAGAGGQKADAQAAVCKYLFIHIISITKYGK